MSYQITVEYQDGQLSVHHEGELPPGRWTVNGHEDGDNRTLSVAQYRADGHPLGQAGSTHHKG